MTTSVSFQWMGKSNNGGSSHRRYRIPVYLAFEITFTSFVRWSTLTITLASSTPPQNENGQHRCSFFWTKEIGWNDVWRIWHLEEINLAGRSTIPGWLSFLRALNNMFGTSASVLWKEVYSICMPDLSPSRSLPNPAGERLYQRTFETIATGWRSVGLHRRTVRRSSRFGSSSFGFSTFQQQELHRYRWVRWRVWWRPNYRVVLHLCSRKQSIWLLRTHYCSHLATWCLSWWSWGHIESIIKPSFLPIYSGLSSPWSIRRWRWWSKRRQWWKHGRGRLVTACISSLFR